MGELKINNKETINVNWHGSKWTEWEPVKGHVNNIKTFVTLSEKNACFRYGDVI